MDTPTPPRPWDQQPDEPAESYKRFLQYLALGPARTVEEAIRRNRAAKPDAKPSRAKAQKGAKRVRANNGAWREDSVTYRWIERANQYDISMLTQSISNTASIIIEALNEYARRYVASIRRKWIAPESFSDQTAGGQFLASFIPAETLQALVNLHAGADGAGADQPAGADTSAGG